MWAKHQKWRASSDNQSESGVTSIPAIPHRAWTGLPGGDGRIARTALGNQISAFSFI